MTYDEALYVLENPDLYCVGWVMYAMDVVQTHERQNGGRR